MTPRPQAVRVGVFALGGVVLLLAALVAVFGSALFARTDQAVMHFRGSVYGLQVGAPVVFRGVRIGSVRSIGVVFEGDGFAVPVVAALDRERIRNLQGGPALEDPRLSLPALVARGLSAQLATQSLLTGQLYVDLDLRDDVQLPPPRSDGMVEIPTTLTRFQSLQDQLDQVDLTQMAQDLSATLGAARTLLAGPELKATLAELAQASAALARLSRTLEQRAGPLLDTARSTLEQTSQAADRVGTAADQVSGAADRVSSAAERADTLLAPDSALMTSTRQAADELALSAAALRAATADESTTVQALQRAMGDVSRAARALRDLAETIDDQPQVLIRGRSGESP
jgi:paraquat-inducible protein B